MTIFTAANNQVGMFFESGAYGNSTGATLQWVGQVQSHDLNPTLNVAEKRYLGGGDRNVQQFVDSAQDYEGNLVFHPQDWKFLFFALGSVVDAGSPSPYTHVISEANGAGRYNAYTSGTLNPFVSFQIEDAQVFSTGSNFVRTAIGAIVNDLTISASQGDLVTVEVNYVPQTVNFASGAATAITEATTRPFMFSDIRMHIPSGTGIVTTTDISWNISNNLDRKHYLNGSRVLTTPIPTERLYELGVTLDATAIDTKTLWDAYFIGGSTFNSMIEIRDSGAGLGSRDAYIIMSGCKMIDMEAPSALEGINSQVLTIRPQNAIVNVNDTTQLYTPW